MRYQKIIGGGLAVAVGGFLILRPFAELYASAYPIGLFLNQLIGIKHIDAQEYPALLAMATFYLAHIVAGLLVISFGFDSLWRFRKPLLITLGIFVVLIASLIAYIAL